MTDKTNPAATVVVPREPTLLPCPFCGKRAEIKRGVHTKYIMCLGCEIMGPNLSSDDELIAQWNARVAAAPPAEPSAASEVMAIEPVAWMVEGTYDGEEIMRDLFDCEEEAAAFQINNGGVVYPLARLSPAECVTAEPSVEDERWLPIESAPRDGTRICLGKRGLQYIYTARWEVDPGWHCEEGKPCWAVFMADDDYYSIYLAADWPTDWQPLPHPPKEPRSHD